jgi:sporulation protein YlmC with PRC-barrel domain
MDMLRLSEIIGKEIADLRFHYVPENEYGLQSFHAYLKLSDDTIIDIPKFDDDVYLHLTTENLDYLKSRFDNGAIIEKKLKTLIIGQKITDIFFCYYNNEVDVDFSAIIKLSNNMYLSEKNFGPVGITNVDLILLNEEEFNIEKQRLQSINVTVEKFESK